MKEFVKKLIEKLEEMKLIRVEQCHDDYEIEVMTESNFDNAISIVNQLAEEYKGGWIPVSEKLPEIDGNTSDTVLVCTIDGFQHMAFWCDDEKWRYCESGMIKNPMDWTEIIAWQPLPPKYEPKE